MNQMTIAITLPEVVVKLLERLVQATEELRDEAPAPVEAPKAETRNTVAEPLAVPESPKRRSHKKKPVLESTVAKAVEADLSLDDDLTPSEKAFVAPEADDGLEEINGELDEEFDENFVDGKLIESELLQLKKALNGFAVRNGREATLKTLNKYAKTSQDVKSSDFSAIMKDLKV